MPTPEAREQDLFSGHPCCPQNVLSFDNMLMHAASSCHRAETIEKKTIHKTLRWVLREAMMAASRPCPHCVSTKTTSQALTKTCHLPQKKKKTCRRAPRSMPPPTQKPPADCQHPSRHGSHAQLSHRRSGALLFVASDVLEVQGRLDAGQARTKLRSVPARQTRLCTKLLLSISCTAHEHSDLYVIRVTWSMMEIPLETIIHIPPFS